MKQFYILFILITSVASAQIPANYYDAITTQTGFDLKTALRDIVTNGHTARSYDQLFDGAGISGSQGYVDTHSDINVSSGNNYENDGTVLDFYSENPTGADPYNFTHNVDNGGNQTQEGDCYNREHLIPQSVYNSQFPMQSDIHCVIPTDCRVNNFRGSLPFGEVASANWTSMNGSLRGSSDIVGYSGTMFEPIDEFKGDIARALLYFAVRYQDDVDTYTYDMFNGTEFQVFETWALDMLLDWHYNVDPVDQRERDRNNAAYDFQGNANPFVDHPEYANLIWNPVTDTEAPTAPTNLLTSNPTDNTIDLTWTASTDNIGVASYDIYVDDVNTFNTSNTFFTAIGLDPDTNYCFEVKAKDAAGNESAFSNEACETTTDNGSTGGNIDLFISEYVEGGGTNKALEIANFTGSTVSLADYTIRLAFNGNDFTTTYNFPNGAQITNEDVYVVANSGLNSACQPEQDDVNNSITGFNGNDVVGLFKNGILIDIIGTVGDDTDFAQNLTLIRNETVDRPNTTYTPSEWNVLPQDDCSDLGQHNQSLSVIEEEFQNFSIYPNPVNGHTFNISITDNVNIVMYDVLGKQVLKSNVTPENNSVDVSRLNSGIYLVKITSGNRFITKKLIKQ
ncbi:endonuclease [Winogradskyella sp. 3972H.M.0a.05]|uniref:endonuclease n=1 Tax=Winogradskyella sp. 3972H.M.0a.05 TaxID=2950277 RepID=UPI00339161DE